MPVGYRRWRRAASPSARSQHTVAGGTGEPLQEPWSIYSAPRRPPVLYLFPLSLAAHSELPFVRPAAGAPLSGRPNSPPNHCVSPGFPRRLLLHASNTEPNEDNPQRPSLTSAIMMSMNSKQHFSMHPMLHEPKYTPLHSSSEAIRRACLPTPSVSGEH